MHDLTLAGLYADRLTLVDHGLVVAAGPAAEVLRPDMLRTFYGADVTVHHAGDGTVVVIPRRAAPPAAAEPEPAEVAVAVAEVAVSGRRSYPAETSNQRSPQRMRSASAGPHEPRK
jgi:hypothetical protein